MPRVGVSTSGNIWVSKFIAGGLLLFFYSVLVILGILGIAALLYALT